MRNERQLTRHTKAFLLIFFRNDAVQSTSVCTENNDGGIMQHLGCKTMRHTCMPNDTRHVELKVNIPLYRDVVRFPLQRVGPVQCIDSGSFVKCTYKKWLQ